MLTIAAPALAPPPELTAETYASKLLGELEAEMQALNNRARSAAPTARIALDASTNLRVLAADLLTWGDLGGAEGSYAVISGVRLSRQRDAIDQSLIRLVEIEESLAGMETPDPTNAEQFRLARDSIRRFNDLAVERAATVRTRDVLALDRALAVIVQPLADAVAQLENGPIVSHWLVSKSTDAEAEGTGDRTAAPFSYAAMRARVDSGVMLESTRTTLLEILDFLERGEAYVEFRPYVRAYQPLIVNSLDLLAGVQHTPWLSDDARTQYQEWIDGGVATFRDRPQRDLGEQRLRLMTLSHELLQRITGFVGASEPQPPLRETLFSLEREAASGGELASVRRRMESLIEILNRALASRAIAVVEPEGDLRAMFRQMLRAHERAEEALFERIQKLGDDPAALADPAFTSLVLDHRDTLENLRLLQAMPEWIAKVQTMHTRAARTFENQVRRVAGWLLDPGRRDEALRVIRTIESQLRRFDPMPFEDALRRPDANAIAATGALHVQLLQRLDEQRKEWIEAWSRGDFDGPDAQRMERLYLLVRTMSDTGEIHRLGGDPSLLNRWTPLELDPVATARALSELPNRLKLATAAVIDGDEESLVRHLDSMREDSLLVMLLGRLTARIGDAIATLPDGPRGIVGQVMHPPPEDAWMIAYRADIAHLCRYVQELEHAAATQEDALAYDLRRYLADLAQRLLEAIDNAPPAEPAPHTPGASVSL